jgi:molecular chaperone GrpE
MTRIPIDDGNEITEETDQEQPPREAAAPPGGGGSGGPSGSGPDDPQRLREERDTYYDRWVRSKADAENMRKRMQGEFDQRCQYANQSLIKSLLPVIDNFERALAQDASKVDAAAILKGMQIVHDQWLSVLRQQNVEEIAPTPGTPFDPTRHEALMQQDAPQYKSPTVTQLLQKGYALQGRTLRPAQVAVSRTS